MINKTIAICQPSIILGGRLRVIIEMVRACNELGIIPDILTTKTNFNEEQITDFYGTDFKAVFRYIPVTRTRGLSSEFLTLKFNGLLQQHAHHYNLLVNTSNSLARLPKNSKVLSYVFFPRKARIFSPFEDIHLPGVRRNRYSLSYIQNCVLRFIYSRINPKRTNHHIISMTRYTQSVLHRFYGDLGNLPIIYPAVDMDLFSGGKNPSFSVPQVVTAGRFSKNKRQHIQIQVARELPNLEFHIAGFASTDTAYFRECQNAARELNNVHLHPNVIFRDLVSLMQESRFFLHTMINEPFGLTSVQAIASGCIPIVHASGGQIETVENPLLQYNDDHQIESIMNQLNNKSKQELDNIQSYLLKKIEKFSPRMFRESFRQQILKFVKIQNN